MSKQEQMIEDLTKRIGERLRLWVEDSHELFDAGRLSDNAATEAIIAQLLYGVTAVISKHMPPETDVDVVKAFARLLGQARQFFKDEKKS